VFFKSEKQRLMWRPCLFLSLVRVFKSLDRFFYSKLEVPAISIRHKTYDTDGFFHIFH